MSYKRLAARPPRRRTTRDRIAEEVRAELTRRPDDGKRAGARNFDPGTPVTTVEGVAFHDIPALEASKLAWISGRAKDFPIETLYDCQLLWGQYLTGSHDYLWMMLGLTYKIAYYLQMDYEACERFIRMPCWPTRGQRPGTANGRKRIMFWVIRFMFQDHASGERISTYNTALEFFFNRAKKPDEMLSLLRDEGVQAIYQFAKEANKRAKRVKAEREGQDYFDLGLDESEVEPLEPPRAGTTAPKRSLGGLRLRRTKPDEVAALRIMFRESVELVGKVARRLYAAERAQREAQRAQ